MRESASEVVPIVVRTCPHSNDQTWPRRKVAMQPGSAPRKRRDHESWCMQKVPATMEGTCIQSPVVLEPSSIRPGKSPRD